MPALTPTARRRRRDGAVRACVMALVAIAAAALAGGCGGSSGSAATTAAGPITRAQFVAKANAICARGNAEQQAQVLKLGSDPSDAEVQELVQSYFIPAVRAQIAAIAALGAPAGEAAAVSRLLALAHADLKQLEGNPGLAESGKSFARFGPAAHAYGLTSCAKGQ